MLGEELTMERSDWLIVESSANWSIDQKNGFSFYGVTARFEYLSDRLKQGDRLFAYVTKRSAFSDIREITKPGLRKLRGGGEYEMPMPFCIDTRPSLTLPEERWLSIADVRETLKLTAGKPHWSHVFRTSFKRLDPLDGRFLTEAMEARIKTG